MFETVFYVKRAPLNSYVGSITIPLIEAQFNNKMRHVKPAAEFLWNIFSVVYNISYMACLGVATTVFALPLFYHFTVLQDGQF